CCMRVHAHPLQGLAPSRCRTGSTAFPALLLPIHLHFTVLTSAYPRHYPRPWLLEESLPVHHTVGTCSRLSRRGRTGLLRSQFPWLASVGWGSPPGFYGSADPSVWKAAGALSCAVLAPARQPLALVRFHDGSTHLRLRYPWMPAGRDTRTEAARLRRLAPLQAVEDQSRAWGLCCHSCTGREGFAPS